MLRTESVLQNRVSGKNTPGKEVTSTDQAKSEFLAAVSHELRTPLTSIKAAIALLKGLMPENTSRDLRELLEIADRNSDALTLLITDLLDFENAASGSLQFESAIHEITGLTQDIVAANIKFFKSHPVYFDMADANNPIWVRIDKHRLEQVLRNLLTNAVKFSKSGQNIEISVARRHAGVRVSVRDYGIGISDEHRDKIFERFSQIDSSDTRNIKGMGLGLAFTKALVEKMGCEIGFESEPGIGSTFYVDIPEIRPQSRKVA